MAPKKNEKTKSGHKGKSSEKQQRKIKQSGKKNKSGSEARKIKLYKEFNHLSAPEIQARLDAFDHLINTTMAQEFQAAQARQDWVELQQPVRQSDTALHPGHALSLPDEFWIIAHRGWSGSYPENTLIGLREAIKLGCHMIEFDVTLTKDRKPIIIHDKTLSRTTNGYGKVHKYTFQELRRLDAGSWFHPKYAGAHLPSLDEILLIAKGAGIRINIEIKKECWEDDLPVDSIEHQIINAIEKYRVTDRVIISSFRWGFIKRIHEIAPHVQKALLHYKSTATLDPARLKKEYGISSFNPQEIELNQKFVNKCHDAGLKVLPFTINTYRDMEQYINMGVDGMFTNHPNRLFRFLDEQKTNLHAMAVREQTENQSDVANAIQRLEEEELDKARRRARWRAKRLLLESQAGNVEQA
ncbi:MAG: hypothetical protein KDK39_10905 [Leptospiraceae bacterium]|nr:hypothetical protein [Leptospiraceae bacterium]